MKLRCAVCEKEDSPKYKCPQCWTPYCSVSCCKQHKENGCNELYKKPQVKSEPSPKRVRYLYPTDDTIPLEKLELLRHNKNLLDILSNPHVRTIMESVNKCDNPTELIHKAMLEPIFVEFADECLKVVQEK